MIRFLGVQLEYNYILQNGAKRCKLDLKQLLAAVYVIIIQFTTVLSWSSQLHIHSVTM